MKEYQLTNELNNVIRYATSEDLIYIVGKQHIRVISNDDVIHSVKAPDSYQNVYASSRGCIMPYLGSYKTAYYSNLNSEINVINGIIAVALDARGDCFYGNTSKESNKFYKYDLAASEEIWSVNSRLFNFYQCGNNVYGKPQADKTKLYCLSKSRGVVNWEYDFSDIGASSFFIIIGERDGVLYVPIQIGINEGQIIGLNANTGKIAFKSSSVISGDRVSYDKLPLIYNWSFVDSERIIGICDCWIYVVNIMTSEITLFNKDSYLSSHDIRKLNSSYRVSSDEENLFLMGHQKMKHDIENYIPTAYILAVDKESYEIKWKYSVENPAEAPRLIGDRLLQRLSDDRLLIFNRQ